MNVTTNCHPGPFTDNDASPWTASPLDASVPDVAVQSFASSKPRMSIACCHDEIIQFPGHGGVLHSGISHTPSTPHWLSIRQPAMHTVSSENPGSIQSQIDPDSQSASLPHGSPDPSSGVGSPIAFADLPDPASGRPPRWHIYAIILSLRQSGTKVRRCHRCCDPNLLNWDHRPVSGIRVPPDESWYRYRIFH